MSTNISQTKRENLLKKISLIKEHIIQNGDKNKSSELVSYLNELEKELVRLRYGLVFEEHIEKIDEIYYKTCDMLTEMSELSIKNNGIFNALLEGDNLPILRTLNKTHREKIDIIYIDPPYNTGNKDFIYDDSCVDSLDTFKHSKWLSFMQKRLVLASDLLKRDGIIFISIDDNEYAPLKLLCDSIFGDENYVSTIIWQKAFAPKNDNKYISTSHEYILLYAKDKSKYKRNLLPRTEKNNVSYKNPDDDPRGPWTSGTMLATTFSQSGVFGIQKPNGDTSFPPEGRCWRYSRDRVETLIKENRVYFGNDGSNVPRIKRFLSEVQQGIVPQSLWFHTEVGNNQNATNELQTILGKQAFSFPKPASLIKQCLRLHANKNAAVLDFFAGSGTTGDAVMQLNAEDGGCRNFILCTNNENNICEEITLERLKRVISKNSYPAFVKYYRLLQLNIENKMYYEYADKLLNNIKSLVELENFIDFDSNYSIKIIVSDEDFAKFLDSDFSKISIIYVGYDVIITDDERLKLESAGVSINIIPDYYYSELRD